jgi:hypothetical protein
LSAIAKENDLQGLIYEYCNYINDAEIAKSATVIPADIQGEHQTEITYLLLFLLNLGYMGLLTFFSHLYHIVSPNSMCFTI